MHVSTARESEMCYSLSTSVGDVTRLNVANVNCAIFVVYVADLEILWIVDMFVDKCGES